MLLTCENISKNYGTKNLVENVSFYLADGDKVGIIGINGTGKSTFMKIIAGAEPQDEGERRLMPGIRISYLPQNPEMNSEHTILEAVFADSALNDVGTEDFEAKNMLTRLGFSDFTQKIGVLSGGQKKRVALAAALMRPAELLVLDEPTNHLDSEMVAWLEDYLIRFSGGIVMVTHDRYFLERSVNRITELSRGKIYNYEGNYSLYLELKAQRAEMNQASERKRQSLLRTEYQWIMRGARARSTKSKDRIERYEQLKNQSAPEVDTSVQNIGLSNRLGKKTIEIENISKSFDDRCVIKNFTYNFLRDDRIGIVGHNGAGKSTLLNIICGQISPDEGRAELGDTVKIGYFSQESREMPLDRTVYSYIWDIADEIDTAEGKFSASMMLERFLFTPDMYYTQICRLSGGERRRLFLLGIIMSAPNVLLLDEPTNDLDIETLTVLEDYIGSFAGIVAAVSHDRYFLDKVASQIFEVRDDGEIVRYTGNYADYADVRAQNIKNEPKHGDKSSAERTVREKKLKFTFKEQKEYESIDDDIAALEAKIAKCDAMIELFASDFSRLSEIYAEKESVAAELDKKTERWIFLNELAEKIADQDK